MSTLPVLITDTLYQLLPLLLRGLLLSDSDVKANVIDTLLIVAEEDSIRQSPIAEHVSTLINAMLQNVAGAQSTAVSTPSDSWWRCEYTEKALVG